jgi:hypothetical protein
MKPAILIVGNVVDGVEFYGPFSTTEEAIELANIELRNREDWCIGYLNNPEVDR